ncbi:ABC transporter ATP-binding protein [Rhodoligotrophos defluvii]|uniref:ABC transporter ATP-binding protein n=1 Tax=Rhodoligotrophos defluvii TaxID=2561934 RepID=UPI0010C985F7|nr:ABC transporter ATP-binding protein [Rhodoligotrophos defluvii]
MLRVEALGVRYGGVVALDDVTLEVRAGTIACLLGANGAGKSTLMKAILGLVPASTGSIQFEGHDVLSMPTEQRVGRGLALVPEGRQLFGDLTVEENIRMGAYLRRDGLDEDFAEVMALFPRLAERRRQFAKTLSGGEQQMVAIGRGLMSKPRLLLLDEPSLGLAPIFVREVMRLIDAIHRKGITVFLVEQNARQALSIAEDAFVLEKGRLVRAGPAAELVKDQTVAAAYLGHGITSKHKEETQ